MGAEDAIAAEEEEARAVLLNVERMKLLREAATLGNSFPTGTLSKTDLVVMRRLGGSGLQLGV